MMHPFTRRTVALATAIAAFALAAPAAADHYDPQEAGHPARIVAYALHPIGVLLDLLIFRPAYWIGSHEPLATFFGQKPYKS